MDHGNVILAPCHSNGVPSVTAAAVRGRYLVDLDPVLVSIPPLCVFVVASADGAVSGGLLLAVHWIVTDWPVRNLPDAGLVKVNVGTES